MRHLRKLLAGVLTTALLFSLGSAALAAAAPDGPDELLAILEQLYAEAEQSSPKITLFASNNGISVVDVDDDTTGDGTDDDTDTSDSLYDDDHVATITFESAVDTDSGTATVAVYANVDKECSLNGVQMTIAYDEDYLTYVSENSTFNTADFDYPTVTISEKLDSTLSLVFANANNVDLTNSTNCTTNSDSSVKVWLTTLAFNVGTKAVAGSTLSLTTTSKYITYNSAEDDGGYTTRIYNGTGTGIDTTTTTITVPTKAVITIGKADIEAVAGETVEVPIYISANYPGGANGIQMSVSYETSVLTYTGYVFGTSASEATVQSATTGENKLDVSLIWANAGNIAVDDLFVTLTFTVADELTIEDDADTTTTSITGEITYVTYEPEDDASTESYVKYDSWDVVYPDDGEACVITLSAAAAYLLGDVNNDGKIDSTDATLVLQYEAALISENTENITFIVAAADVNGDTRIDSTDATLILQYEAQLITAFGASS